MVFSDTTTNLGIVQQVRSFMRADANQWPIAKIVNSVNNYLNTVTGYAIGADRRFLWDDTNQTKLPVGTTNLVANQSDYSFLTDEQGNPILNLSRIDILDSSGFYRKLIPIEQSQIPDAIDEELRTAGLPTHYAKIADNIVRLFPKPISSVTAGLKFYFQRTGVPFAATGTDSVSPGVSPLLHRGFVVAAVYDGMLTLMADKAAPWANEYQKEFAKMVEYFSNRTPDEPKQIIGVRRSSR